MRKIKWERKEECVIEGERVRKVKRGGEREGEKVYERDREKMCDREKQGGERG